MHPTWILDNVQNISKPRLRDARYKRTVAAHKSFFYQLPRASLYHTDGNAFCRSIIRAFKGSQRLPNVRSSIGLVSGSSAERGMPKANHALLCGRNPVSEEWISGETHETPITEVRIRMSIPPFFTLTLSR